MAAGQAPAGTCDARSRELVAWPRRLQGSESKGTPVRTKGFSYVAGPETRLIGVQGGPMREVQGGPRCAAQNPVFSGRVEEVLGT